MTSKSKNWVARACAFAVVFSAGTLAMATVQDASIVIDHALHSPTLTIRYSGAHVAMVELRLNGVSYATRKTDATPAKGETNFSLDPASLTDGDNDVDVHLYDKNGKLVGTEHSTVVSDDGHKAPVFLEVPKSGATVQGPVEINLGFGKDLRNVYVSFFIDNQFKSMSNTPPFDYIWDTSHDANGWHDLEAWVVDDTSATFKTRKVKVFVNNPGGLTIRQPNPIAPTPAPAPTPVLPTTPKPTPISLQPSGPILNTSLQTSSAGAKAAGTAAASAAGNALHSLAPAVANHIAKPAVTPISNSVKTATGAPAGLKSENIATPISTGPRMLLPTGKRIAAEGQPALYGPIGKSSGLHSLKTTPTPAAKITPLPKVSTVPTVPTVPKAAVAKPKPESAISVVVVKPQPATKVQPEAKAAVKPVATQPKATAVQPKPVVAQPKPAAVQPQPAAQPKAAALPKVQPTVKEATEPKPAATPQKSSTAAVSKAATAVTAAKVIAVGHGTKLANVATYSISLNAKPVTFDSVKPRVTNNVPLTPFRYLFEQSGGKVNWADKTKSVTANAPGKDIYIRIGDKLAKVNSLPVQLDLTPFIENGRTIVPLSFIKDALDVEVDYDPVTNHVLITSIKKK